MNATLAETTVGCSNDWQVYLAIISATIAALSECMALQEKYRASGLAHAAYLCITSECLRGSDASHPDIGDAQNTLT